MTLIEQQPIMWEAPSQYLFKEGQAYYLVEVGSQGVTLKIKEHGWSDTWSLPLDECDHLGRTHDELTVEG